MHMSQSHKVYPRFSSNTAEADLKKLFKQQMKEREKAKLAGEPLEERRAAGKQALTDALTADDKKGKPLP